ncbi:MAG TPA: penicillin-binding protein 2 [Rhizomicrobium sp.]|jgi:cell division protein FtsI (penicillin-binding protein 3)|nr:penicillin-binding protein 2 [Rhizomicrobium sp.]
MNQTPPAEGFQRRIVVAAAFCVAAFALVLVRLADVSLLHGGISGGAVDSYHPIALRADMIDRNGKLLARDLPVQDLYARPHALWDKEQAAHDLAAATGASVARLMHVFNSPRNYALVARQLTPDQQDRVMHLGLPGLDFQLDGKRFYPEGRAAAQVIGVTDPDGKGVAGLEMGLDKRLSMTVPGQPVPQVRTSLDMRVQYILAHEASLAKDEFNAKAAGGIVLDVRTGEVIAMMSLPDYDPNVRHLGDGDSARNVMAQDVYELGSVFKVFSFTLAMEDRTIGLDDVLPIGAGYRIGKWTIHDAEHMPATLTARDVLAQSSNAGTAQIALRSGPDRQKAFLTHMGLLTPVKSELPETAFPLYPKDWKLIQTATVGFGHGISVSPLSFATAAAAVVNGGRKIVPTFLRRDTDARGEQLIKPETSDTMRGLLRYVVTNGTGKLADVPGYNVGGKTGSAEKNVGGHYVAHKLLTSFCAVFPVDHPRYIVFVLLDEPHGDKAQGVMALAGHTAAPVAGRVIARIAPILGVPQEPVLADAKENP